MKSLYCSPGKLLLCIFYIMFLYLLLSARRPARGQTPFILHGRVLSAENQEPLPGASVLLKSSVQGSSTDQNGYFSLTLPEKSPVLTVSFIGYRSVDTVLALPLSKPLVITMQPDVAMLEQTIVIGYGTTTRKLNTGSVAKIGGDILQKQPVSNLLAAIAGRVPGVFVQQNTGVPGGGISIQIRGRNSLRAEANNPFYIIDGVPFPSASLSSSSAAGQILGGVGNNPLSSINPADIESIEILKDADATAIYGSRGANGVVLITTRKSAAGKTKIDVNLSSGFSKVARKMQLLSTPDYLTMRKEAFTHDNATPAATDYDLTEWDAARQTDWQKKMIGSTATRQTAGLSLSGGKERTSFLFGGSFERQTTVFQGDFDYRKAAAHMSINHSSENGRFNLSTTTSYTTDNSTLPQTDMTAAALSLPPSAPAVYLDGEKLNWTDHWPGLINPYYYLKNTYRGSTAMLIANTVLSYEILSGLNLKTSLGYNDIQKNENTQSPGSARNPAWATAAASAIFADNHIKSWIAEPQLTYGKTFGRARMELLLGSTFQQNTAEQNTIFADGYSSDALLGNMKAAASLRLSDATYARYRYQSVFARINYNFKSRYILNVTGRRDGSSRFGPGKRSGNFGAVGGAWLFASEELVRRHVRWLSQGKLRASYGLTGSDQIPDYGYLDTYTPLNYTYQNIKGLVPTRLRNADFQWETNRKFEVAVELGFWADKLLASAAYFNNRSANQLVGYPLPDITGFSSVQANLNATVENSGWELTLSAAPVKTAGFLWNASLNLTAPANRLIRFDKLSSSAYASQFEVGKSLGVQRKYHVTGVDAETGIYQLLDVNGDGKLSAPADYLSAKKLGPTLFTGLENSFQYKGIQLDFLIQYTRQQGSFYMPNAPGALSNQPAYVMERWQKSGDQTTVGRFTQRFGADAARAYQNAYILGDRGISDASYLRLKNVSLAWQLPNSLTSRLHLSQARLFMQAQNYVTLTGFKGPDPENYSSQQLPPLKTLMLGMHLTI